MKAFQKRAIVAVAAVAIAALPEDSPGVRSLKAGKTRMVMLHKPAPALVVERFFGDMKQMYADLKDKGLEVLHVTTYYGYYKNENRMKRDMPAIPSSPR